MPAAKPPKGAEVVDVENPGAENVTSFDEDDDPAASRG